MSEALVRAVTRRGVLPAFSTAAGILGYLVVVEFLRTLLSSIWRVGHGVPSDLLVLWTDSAVSTLTSSLPFAIGVFLSFWQIAPIARSLRLAHVVTRALLAAVVGAALSFVVSVVVAVCRQLLAGDLGALGGGALSSLYAAGALVLDLAPLVVLGAILLWGWLQRHPRHYQVRGTLDEV